MGQLLARGLDPRACRQAGDDLVAEVDDLLVQRQIDRHEAENDAAWAELIEVTNVSPEDFR